MSSDKRCPHVILTSGAPMSFRQALPPCHFDECVGEESKAYAFSTLAVPTMTPPDVRPALVGGVARALDPSLRSWHAGSARPIFRYAPVDGVAGTQDSSFHSICRALGGTRPY